MIAPWNCSISGRALARYWYVLDGLGSVITLVDQAGNEVSYYSYAYCHNDPLDCVDPSGLVGVRPEDEGPVVAAFKRYARR